jgi:methionyl aminopeptidase
MKELCGHGVGRAIHGNRSSRSSPLDWGRGELQQDKWTIRTAGRSLSAHYEHTIVITNGEPILLTAA